MPANTGHNPNEALLRLAAERLSPLLDRIAFVGGCATGLLISDPGAAPVRSTLDVDAIIEIASYAEWIVLEDHLRGCVQEATRENQGEAAIKEMVTVLGKALRQ